MSSLQGRLWPPRSLTPSLGVPRSEEISAMHPNQPSSSRMQHESSHGKYAAEKGRLCIHRGCTTVQDGCLRISHHALCLR